MNIFLKSVSEIWQWPAAFLRNLLNGLPKCTFEVKCSSKDFMDELFKSIFDYLEEETWRL